MNTQFFTKMAKEAELADIGIAPAVDEVRRVFDWARSVIVAAICYLPPNAEPPDDKPRGKVARVARSADYHDVLRDKLRHVVEALRDEYPEAKFEICVDTCPISERKLAVLGGIAWKGKSGNVFVDGCGSYAALGEIVTDIELPTTAPLDIDRCGECERCIRACPVGAITAPHEIDPSKCLSHITQMSGLIPSDKREAMENRIYGCDICQEVCPQNVEICPSCEDFAQEMPPGAYPEIIPLIRLSSAEFKATLKNSSIGWIRRTRIRRNAAIAAGNLKCEEAVPALVEMLEDENPILRATAAWALGKVAQKEARQALEQALENETDTSVREEIAAALE